MGGLYIYNRHVDSLDSLEPSWVAKIVYTSEKNILLRTFAFSYWAL